ncbi:MAG: cell division protein SepF [Lachnospiraceae bacterium]|nr:cell division protein SepF [Lachnospiraceae bacterium]
MSVLDKFLNVIKLSDDNDDEYPDEGYLDEPEEDADEPQQKRRITRKDNDDDLFDDEPEKTSSSRSSSRRTSISLPSDDDDEEDTSYERPRQTRVPRSSSKISPIRNRSRKEDAGMEVCVIKPHSIEDEKEIADSLLSNCTVILNLDALEIDSAQRIIDFVIGAVYAMDAHLQRISNSIFLLTPANVEITGDLQEVLNSTFNVPIFDRDY